MKRIALDLLIALSIMLIYLSRFYEALPPPVQLATIKALLVSMGFMHAHITRKLAFPAVAWQTEGINAKTLLVITLYVAFIYTYATGG